MPDLKERKGSWGQSFIGDYNKEVKMCATIEKR